MKILAIFMSIVAMTACYPVIKTWTLQQLSTAIDKKTEPSLLDAQRKAFNQIMLAIFTGQNEIYVDVKKRALDISTWTPTDLSGALENPYTKQELLPYLERAKKDLEEALAAGEKLETISIVTPVGLVPSEEEAVIVPKVVKQFSKKYL